jgi:SAM-dependent methyltransferase
MKRRSFLLTLLALGGCADALNYLRAPPLEAPSIMTPGVMVDEMMSVADIGPSDVVYDLGCGNGGIVIAAAKRGARGVGIDIDPAQIKLANEAAAAARVSDRVQFIVGNLFELDISKATVVTLYLSEDANFKLMPKLQSELRPGTRIVSYQFGMGGWMPNRTVESGGRYVHLWII